MDNLYKTIIDLCESKGISGYRLCKETGVQPSILTDLKMGRQKGLSAKNAEKIASYFGISVSQLLGVDNKKTPTLQESERDYSDEALIDAFNKADEATKEAIRLILKLQ